MSRNSGARGVALLALALLAVATFAPIVAADHAYSHRYVVFGRVIDAENNPVPGLTMDVGTQKPFNPEGPCSNQPGTETQAFGPTQTRPVTNEFGEFMFCFHSHSLSRFTPGTAIVKVESTGQEQQVTFDGFTRYSFVLVKLNEVHPNANKTVATQSYTVQGRAWSASSGEIKVEGVGVYGDTLHNKPGQVVVAFDGQEPRTINVTTNGYGDFAIRVPTEGRPTGGKVTFTIDNHTFEENVDPASGTTLIKAEVGERRTSNVPGPALVLAVGAIAVAAIVLRRRSE